MIKRIYGALPPGYLCNNVIAGRINAYYRAYGTGYDFCTFYSGDIGDDMLALYYGGELYVHCNENTDTESLLAFSDMLGAGAVMSDIRLAEKSETLFIMTSDKAPTVNNSNYPKAEFTEDYRTVFEILKSGFSLGDDQFDDWYADTCHRVRHGVSKLIVMYSDDIPVATATVLFGDDKECLESTIIDLSEGEPMILRPGYVTQEKMMQVIGKVDVDRTILDASSVQAPKAPGMKYRHYAPKGNLTIVEGPQEKVIACINEKLAEGHEQGLKTGVIATDETIGQYQADVKRSLGSRKNEEAIAHHLFEVLRQMDDEEVQLIFTESFAETGLGQATMNRLLKAAGHQVISL